MTIETTRVAAPGSAYVALALGVVAVALIAIPPASFVVGVLGLVAALRARSILRRDNTTSGTVPSLLGAILSIVGVVPVIPWLAAVLIVAVGDGLSVLNP